MILTTQIEKLVVQQVKMSHRSRQYDHLLKYVIVGDSSVGKSCLLLRFADDQFSQNYMTTIGVDFRFKTVNANNRNTKLQIWDTAGQQRFRTITNTYYKSAHAVFLVYDITNMESFESIINFWLGEVESYADPGAVLVLIGNKSDLKTEQTVPTEKAKELANEKNMLFFQTSAKTADHVNESFMSLTNKIVQDLQKSKGTKKSEASNMKTLDLGNKNNSQNRAKGCC